MAKLPSPITAPQPYQRQRSVLEQLLISLVGQAPNLLMAGLGQREQGQQLQGQQQAAVNQLATPEMARTPTGGQFANQLGNARVPTSAVMAQAPYAAKAAAPEADALAKQELRTKAIEEVTRGLQASNPKLAAAFGTSVAMQQAGLDASTINKLVDQTLPLSDQEWLSLAKAKLDLKMTQDEAASDAYATKWLKQNKYIGADAPDTITGAGKTLQAIIQAKDGKAINWMKEGLDFVTGRVGDSLQGGSFNVNLTPTGEWSPGASGGVGIEQAIAEWRAIVERSAPDGERERILQGLDSGAWQNKLTLEVAKRQVSDMLAAGTVDEATVRSTLAASYTPEEIDQIIRAAKRRAGPKR